MLIFKIVFNYHQDIIEIIIELNDTNICVKRNFMNSLGDNKRLFFIFSIFSFFFLLVYKSLSSSRTCRLGKQWETYFVTSRRDNRGKRTKRGEAERKHGNLIMRAALIKARVPIYTKNFSSSDG